MLSDERNIEFHEYQIDAELEYGDGDERGFDFIAMCVREIVESHQRIQHTKAAATE